MSSATTGKQLHDQILRVFYLCLKLQTANNLSDLVELD